MKRRQNAAEKAKKERTKAGPLIGIILLCLILGFGWQLYRLNGQMAQANADKEALAAEVAQMEQENTALEEDIAEGSTVEKMKELAREELDFVEPGEYVFEIIGAG